MGDDSMAPSWVDFREWSLKGVDNTSPQLQEYEVGDTERLGWTYSAPHPQSAARAWIAENHDWQDPWVAVCECPDIYVRGRDGVLHKFKVSPYVEYQIIERVGG